MTETDTPAIGHNEPPVVDPEKIAPLKDRVREFADAAAEWLALGRIDDGDEETAGALADYISGTRKLAGDIEKDRKAAKQPHIDAGKAVDAAYQSLISPLNKAVAKAKALLGDYSTRKAEAERKAREEAQRKAEAERKAAEQAAREAALGNDVVAEAEAEARLKDAEKAEKEAAKVKPVGQVRSASGSGRTMAQRTTFAAEVTNPRLATIWALEHHHDEVVDLLVRLANAEKRRDRSASLPGFAFREVRSIA